MATVWAEISFKVEDEKNLKLTEILISCVEDFTISKINYEELRIICKPILARPEDVLEIIDIISKLIEISYKHSSKNEEDNGKEDEVDNEAMTAMYCALSKVSFTMYANIVHCGSEERFDITAECKNGEIDVDGTGWYYPDEDSDETE